MCLPSRIFVGAMNGEGSIYISTYSQVEMWMTMSLFSKQFVKEENGRKWRKQQERILPWIEKCYSIHGRHLVQLIRILNIYYATITKGLLRHGLVDPSITILILSLIFHLEKLKSKTFLQSSLRKSFRKHCNLIKFFEIKTKILIISHYVNIYSQKCVFFEFR